MKVLKFAWHLFWASRREPGLRLHQLIIYAAPYYRAITDDELIEALRRYGR